MPHLGLSLDSLMELAMRRAESAAGPAEVGLSLVPYIWGCALRGPSGGKSPFCSAMAGPASSSILRPPLAARPKTARSAARRVPRDR